MLLYPPIFNDTQLKGTVRNLYTYSPLILTNLKAYLFPLHNTVSLENLEIVTEKLLYTNSSYKALPYPYRVST